MRKTLIASALAAAFGFGVSCAMAQNADLQDTEDAKQKPTEQEGAATHTPDTKGSETTPRANQPGDAAGGAQTGNEEAADPAKQQSDIPDQSQGGVGHPEQEQTTGQGQGVKESGGAKQPDTGMPEQSKDTTPERDDATGQGDGVGEQR
ncbi:MAG TPA: hypothetical protein VD791_06330 [Burkholderiales bacterium]|nr:hypothetical protein [Burkholderiales bacterium]